MGVIEEVKQKLDIVEVVGQYVALKKAGRNLTALCPFHSEKNPSFFVYPEQQSWHCFGACNTGGDVFSFVMKKENADFGEALRLLAQRAGVTIPSRFEQDTKRDEKERLYQANDAAAQYFHNLLINSQAGEKARNYLDSRGLSLNTIVDFKLGFSMNSWEALKQCLTEKGYTYGERLTAGLVIETEDGETHDRFRNRLMFPINDARGRVTGFGARVLDDSLPKYVNSPQTPIFDKSSSLYGINLAAPTIRQQNLAVIVEGYMDVITAHQNGFTNVIASMGTSITERQVATLKKLTKNITLALDADAAGEEAMLRCVDYENALDTEVKVIILPKSKDPDDVIKEDTTMWQYLLEKALPVVDYTFDMVTAELDLTTTKDKTLAVGKLIPIIAEIKNDTRRDHYLTALSKLTGTSYHNLEATLSSIKPERKAQRRKPEALARAVQPFLSSRIEEECLALLVQHPELRSREAGLLPEYFENSENREIFLAWKQVDAPESFKEKLDTSLWEHLDSLISKKILATQIEERYNKYVLRLREEYLRSLERKKEAALVSEAEAGGTAAELAKLEEQGIETSTGLREIFTQKARRVGSKGDKK